MTVLIGYDLQAAMIDNDAVRQWPPGSFLFIPPCPFLVTCKSAPASPSVGVYICEPSFLWTGALLNWASRKINNEYLENLIHLMLWFSSTSFFLFILFSKSRITNQSVCTSFALSGLCWSDRSGMLVEVGSMFMKVPRAFGFLFLPEITFWTDLLLVLMGPEQVWFENDAPSTAYARDVPSTGVSCFDAAFAVGNYAPSTYDWIAGATALGNAMAN